MSATSKTWTAKTWTAGLGEALPAARLGIRRFAGPGMALAGALALALVLALPGAAHAYSVTYNGFAGATGLTTAYDASLTTDGVAADGTVLQLNPAQQLQDGAGYLANPVTLGAGGAFTTSFQFRFLDTGGVGPADGMTFALTGTDANDKGTFGLTNGHNLGYAWMPNSIAVAFTTFQTNMVSIDVGGSLTNFAAASPYGVTSCDSGTGLGCMANGDLWTVNIGYDGSGLSVSVQDGTAAVQDVINDYPISVDSALAGRNSAYVGFSAATGAGIQTHNVVDWSFANTAPLQSDPPTGVPEPGSLALLGSGVGLLLGVMSWQRRRRARA